MVRYILVPFLYKDRDYTAELKVELDEIGGRWCVIDSPEIRLVYDDSDAIIAEPYAPELVQRIYEYFETCHAEQLETESDSACPIGEILYSIPEDTTPLSQQVVGLIRYFVEHGTSEHSAELAEAFRDLQATGATQTTLEIVIRVISAITERVQYERADLQSRF